MSAPAGRVILITGGARGIGAASARLCAAQGWRVAINYRADAAAARILVDEITAGGGMAASFQADIAEAEAVEGLFSAVAARFGLLDGVVVNAGIIARTSPLIDMDPARIENVLRVNVLGALLTARAAARVMARSRGGQGGAIVFVSSGAARLGSPNEFVDYAASKGAVDTMTLGLAKELAPEGIRVNAVRPGLIETEIHAQSGRPDRVAQMAPGIPMQRAGSADEVAQGILWLLSDAASYTTRALLDITGGR
ncbi:MAG: SDR family oxidoreductase [Neomegalonema sp.]|nr:SDR family oxidoreductase [Neomegalonema sp.]